MEYILVTWALIMLTHFARKRLFGGYPNVELNCHMMLPRADKILLISQPFSIYLSVVFNLVKISL